MKYSSIKTLDMVNGEGIRTTLFVSGCSHGCKGCYNESTWNPNSGLDYTREVEDALMLELSDVRVDGLTLSGGDPLYRRNRETILNLVKRVKHELPDKNIWMWSGYTHQQIMDDPTMAEILSYVDVLVDGKFELENKTAKLPWRGSSNQNLIYLEKA